MNSQESDSWPEAETFVNSLNISPTGELFNPWHHYCDSFDISPCAPHIRRQHLLDYFSARRRTARYLLIGEALSFYGGRFSGIAMTSERMLNNQQTDVVRACHIIPGLDPQCDRRTSNPEKCSRRRDRNHGRLEKTATVVWRVAIQNLHLNSFEFVLWNAVPWHPYKLDEGIPKNRPPKEDERKIGRERLSGFLRLFPEATAVPIGKTAELELYRILHPDISCIPHPAHGREADFRTKICDRFGRLRSHSGTRIIHTLHGAQGDNATTD